jgi:LytR cell envelope-related transcriptional attenuator
MNSLGGARGSARGPQVPPAMRGAILVGLAVIAGIVGIQILDDSDSGNGSAVVVTTSDTTPSTTRGGSGSTSTTVADNGRHDPADVKVAILNASEVEGAATTLKNQLAASGFNVVFTGNLPEPRTGDVVQCRSAFETDGKVLAIYGVAGENVQTMAFPTDPPEGTQGADCIIILGKDA